jgi:FeS assembly SUF system protein
MSNEALENNVIEVLKTIYDPEIPVDVYELGLIYEVKINADKHIDIEMTLTSPNCPVAESMPKEVEDKVAGIEWVKSAKVNIVFDPPWDKDMMSEVAKLELGFL